MSDFKDIKNNAKDKTSDLYQEGKERIFIRKEKKGQPLPIMKLKAMQSPWQTELKSLPLNFTKRVNKKSMSTIKI